MNIIVTAYCACQLCCGPHPTGLTASGAKPVEGITIAAPRSVPFGTKVILFGHTYIVQDRTARRFGGRWDIYFASHKEARKFGRRTITIKIK